MEHEKNNQTTINLLLDEMQQRRHESAIENIYFKKHLRCITSAKVDDLIHELYAAVQHEVDCTQCGNCCKRLEPGIDEDEINRLAELKGVDTISFKQQHVAFDGHTLFLKTKPCMFLSGCKCSIYENRPAACAGFPHLDGKDLKYKRSLWENYHLCPQVYLVLERLKKRTNFNFSANV